MKVLDKLIAIIFLCFYQISYSQNECTVYTDTMYMITVAECEHVTSPRNIIMEPNFGSFWIKDLKRITLDTSNYNAFFSVFFSNSIIVNDIFHDIEQSYWSACAPDTSAEYRKYMLKDFFKKDSKLRRRGYSKKKRCNISKTQFFSYELADTIVADVSITIYVEKMIIDYYIVPYRRIESTIDFQYDYSLYPYQYRYRVKQIKKVLKVKDDELPKW